MRTSVKQSIYYLKCFSLINPMYFYEKGIQRLEMALQTNMDGINFSPPGSLELGKITMIIFSSVSMPFWLNIATLNGFLFNKIYSFSHITPADSCLK